MKRLFLLTLLGSLLALAAHADEPVAKTVTVHLDAVRAVGSHSNVWFYCHVTVNNQTGAPLTVTDLFWNPAGLSLKVMDAKGKELKHVLAGVFKLRTWTLPPGQPQSYDLMYGFPGTTQNAQTPGVAVPDGTKSVRLQVEGKISGSTYTGSVTSNIVDVKVGG